MTKTKHFITILWGTDQEEKKTYSFDSINDLNMFMKGVDEANGWWEYEAINQITKVEKETPEEQAERIKEQNANIQRVDAQTKKYFKCR